MKVEEAISIIIQTPLYRYECDKSTHSDLFKALHKAMSALEKQVAKKLRIEDGKYSQTYRCPNCNLRLISKEITGWFCGQCHNYCPKCGQKLDWSDE